MTESLKSRIVQGATRVDTFFVDELGMDVTVRPLTDGESGEAQAAAVAGQKFRGDTTKGARPTDVEIDAAASAEGQAQARRIKAAYGLSVDGEKWSPADVARFLPAPAVRKIAAKVDELSGGDELAQQARQFRGDNAGADDREAAADGDTAGGDAG